VRPGKKNKVAEGGAGSKKPGREEVKDHTTSQFGEVDD